MSSLCVLVLVLSDASVLTFPTSCVLLLKDTFYRSRSLTPLSTVYVYVIHRRHKTECNDTSFASRLIVLDEFDLHQNFAPFVTKEERLQHYPVVDNSVLWNFLYFKRSFVRRRDGVFFGYPHLAKRDIYPLTYSIAEAYIQSPFNQIRDIDILCTLRGSKKQSTRLRVQEHVQAYIDADPQGLANSVAKQVLNSVLLALISSHTCDS